MASNTAQPEPGRDAALIGLAALMLLVGTLWVAGVASAHLTGHRTPQGHPLGELAAFAHVGDPSAAWHAPVGPAAAYWAMTFFCLSLLVLLGYGAWRLFHPREGSASRDPTTIEGLADRKEVQAAAGPKALLGRAGTLRPSVAQPKPADVGWYLGHSRGVGCWMGVRDSMMVLGPPGARKATT